MIWFAVVAYVVLMVGVLAFFRGAALATHREFLQRALPNRRYEGDV